MERLSVTPMERKLAVWLESSTVVVRGTDLAQKMADQLVAHLELKLDSRWVGVKVVSTGIEKGDWLVGRKVHGMAGRWDETKAADSVGLLEYQLEKKLVGLMVCNSVEWRGVGLAVWSVSPKDGDWEVEMAANWDTAMVEWKGKNLETLKAARMENYLVGSMAAS